VSGNGKSSGNRVLRKVRKPDLKRKCACDNVKGANLTRHNPNVLYELAEIRLLLVLVWITALSCVATVILYKLRFRKTFAIISSLGLISVALMAWVYFNI